MKDRSGLPASATSASWWLRGLPSVA